MILLPADLDKRVAALAEHDPNAKETIANAAGKILLDPEIPASIKSAVNNSPALVELLYTLSSQQEIDKFVTLAKQEPNQAIEKVNQLTFLLDQPVSTIQ